MYPEHQLSNSFGYARNESYNYDCINYDIILTRQNIVLLYRSDVIIDMIIIIITFFVLHPEYSII